MNLRKLSEQKRRLEAPSRIFTPEEAMYRLYFEWREGDPQEQNKSIKLRLVKDLKTLFNLTLRETKEIVDKAYDNLNDPL